MPNPVVREPRLSPAAVRDVLRARVGQEWRVGDRLPPVKSLARHLGAGQSATNRAVQELVREGLLISRRRSGTVVATPQAGRPTLFNRNVLVVRGVPNPIIPFVDVIVQAMAGVIETAGGRVEPVVTLPNAPSAPPPHDLVVVVNPRLSDVLSFAGPAPLVVVSTSLDHFQMPTLAYDLIGVDQRQAAGLAGQLLRERGVAEACFVGRCERRGEYDATSAHRLAGFEAGLGQRVRPTHRVDCEGYSITAGGRGLRRYLELAERPRAVFAVTDEIALGFLAAAASHGLEAGRDFWLVGFDGVEQDKDARERNLTTVDVPLQEMGRRAGQMIIERLTQPRSANQRFYLGCSLFVGKTT